MQVRPKPERTETNSQTGSHQEKLSLMVPRGREPEPGGEHRVGSWGLDLVASGPAPLCRLGGPVSALGLSFSRLSRMTSEGPAHPDSWGQAMGCTSGARWRLLPEPRLQPFPWCTEDP